MQYLEEDEEFLKARGEWEIVVELLQAAEDGDLGRLSRALNCPEVAALIDGTDYNGTTALLQASRWGNLRACELLLAAGADPRRRSRDGYSAWCYGESVEDDFIRDEMTPARRLFEAYGLRWEGGPPTGGMIEMVCAGTGTDPAAEAFDLFRAEAKSLSLPLEPENRQWQRVVGRRRERVFQFGCWLTPGEAAATARMLEGLRGREGVLETSTAGWD